MSRAGYVLAGGQSSRMHADKALLPFRGATLVETVAREVAGAAGSAVVVGRPAGFQGLPSIPDVFPGEGPLGGILTCLRHTTSDWNLIVACDMPALTAAFLRELLDAAEEAGARALVPCGRQGLPEPLCAVYHRSLLASIEENFARGIRKVTAAFEWHRYPTDFDFRNVNTPEDWAAYAG